MKLLLLWYASVKLEILVYSVDCASENDTKTVCSLLVLGKHYSVFRSYHSDTHFINHVTSFPFFNQDSHASKSSSRNQWLWQEERELAHIDCEVDKNDRTLEFHSSLLLCMKEHHSLFKKRYKTCSFVKCV